MLTIPQRLTKYFWLSLFWESTLALPFLLGLFYFIDKRSTSGPLEILGNMSAGLLLALPFLMASAWVGNLLRRPFMPALLQRAQAATTLLSRITWLVGGTMLLFVASVLFCTAVFTVFFFGLSLSGIRYLTQSDLLWPIARTFFLLSASWLLTAPAAACWVCRDWLRPATAEAV